METPKTYVGYDKDENVIASQTGEDANNFINPDEIQAAIQEVKQVTEEECKSIVSNLQKLIPDVKSAISVKGKTMAQSVEQIGTVTESVPAAKEGAIGNLYNEAVQKHDQKQIENNEAARSSVASHSGVVRVEP